MGSLDFSSQAMLASNTQSTHLIKHSHTQQLDMNRTFWGTKTRNKTRLKQPSDNNFGFQGHFIPNVAKNKFINTQENVVSPLNRWATQK